MKQKLRRFMAGFLAILTMFTTLFTNGTTVFAASSSANISFWYASAKDHGVISEFNSNHKGGILYAMIDGHSAIFIEFTGKKCFYSAFCHSDIQTHCS